MVITRKVQVNFVIENKEELKELYEKIYGWQRICFHAANWVATHLWIQDNIKNLHYIIDETKVKLGDMKKDPDGILTCSRDNTTYQVLSRRYKGECPMGMLSGLNTIIAKTYKKESKDVNMGLKSLRSYKRDIPMPVRMGDVSGFTKTDDGNYTFTVYGIQFKTWFGRDMSGNELMFDRAVAGEYKLCDSMLKLEKNKLFFLAVLEFEKQELALDQKKICEASLDINCPIRVNIGKKEYTIGTAEEFLHRRLAIQGSLRRVQAASRYNAGGRGRKRKMQAIEQFKEKESNYVTTRIHQYTFKLIDLCVKMKCGKLVLKDQAQKEEEAKTDKEFLLRNWSYYGMKEKIMYKAAKYGIEVVVE